MAGINKTDCRHDERADQVRRCVTAGISNGAGSYLQFRDWIRQETLCDRSLVTFDVRQCAMASVSERSPVPTDVPATVQAELTRVADVPTPNVPATVSTELTRLAYGTPSGGAHS